MRVNSNWLHVKVEGRINFVSIIIYQDHRSKIMQEPTYEVCGVVVELTMQADTVEELHDFCRWSKVCHLEG